MSFYYLLTNAKDKVTNSSFYQKLTRKDPFEDYANNMQPLQPIEQSPNLPLIQVSENNNGGLDSNVSEWQDHNQSTPETFRARMQNMRSKFTDALLGKKENPTDSIDTNGELMNATISENPRIGGALPDLINGFKENYNNGFNLNNFGNNSIDFNRNKGLMYRVGEGLGTIGRIAESPLGRGLITAGIVGATGGNGLEALAYGGQAGIKNQQLRNTDNLYRNSLNTQGIDTSNVKGYISDNTYKNLATANNNMLKTQNQLAIAMQKDNTSRARMIMQGLNNGSITPEAASTMISMYGITNADFQESNNTRNTKVNEYLAPHKANMYDSGAQASIINANANNTRANAYDYAVHNPTEKAGRISDMPGYAENLAYYVSMPTRTKEEREAKANARRDFIAAYKGTDPERVLGDNY